MTKNKVCYKKFNRGRANVVFAVVFVDKTLFDLYVYFKMRNIVGYRTISHSITSKLH